MKKTTQDVIKVLPLESTLKDQLLKEFETYDADTRFEIEQIVWRAYDEIRMLKLEENLRKAIESAETISPDLYQKVKAQTDQELQQADQTEIASSDIKDAREELQSIIHSQSN